MFFDLDESLGRLQGLPGVAVVPCSTWADLRAALQADGWAGVSTIVVDSLTKAEELAVEHTLLNTLQDGKRCTSVSFRQQSMRLNGAAC